ncbi:BTAD domain-containing putative transcriptional regulator [Asanoa sp. NPDC049573]|uniref:BTAD domain-containing putative transcriptional regulator n=1 Tax=Asanoa sp. NPDC049573 TaxID=3155396 RepID=UPI00342AA0C7
MVPEGRDGVCVAESLGSRLRACRVRAGLTQQQLAARSGVGVRTLRDIEHDQVRHPQSRSLRQISVALGLADENEPFGRVAPPDQVRVAILGPLLVFRGETEVVVGSPLRRRLLGLLALHAGRAVSITEIVEVLWGDLPPPSGVSLVHSHVARLRQLLEVGSSGQRHPRLIVRRGAGYLLEAAGELLDLARFDKLVTQADSARKAGQLSEAVDLLGSALDCWRGPTLVDLDSLTNHPASVAATHRRVEAALTYADLCLEAKHYQPAVRRLRAIAHEQPLHEGLHARLMLTVAFGGEQAAALDVFSSIRHRLDSELGMQPGAELQAAHLRVLRHDVTPSSDTAGQGRPPVESMQNEVPSTAAPWHGLPRDTADFSGRRWAVADLVRATAESVDTTGPLIAAVDGMAGVGKTALVVHVAHKVASRYPDIAVFLDLHGHSHDTPPMEPAAALGALLRQCGVAAERIPQQMEDRIALWRSVLSGRRALVVLDNAASSAQISPLLPGSSGSLVLVTSRRRLAGLDGIHALSLDVFSLDEAVALLGRIVGRRIADERGAAEEIAELCGCLPLAVRLAGARLLHRPRWSATDLVGRLRGAAPLEQLAAEGRTVAAAFTVSYEQLSEPARRVFRLLGLQPGADIDAYATGALTGCTVAQAEAVLEDLVDAHLIEATSAHRYRLHDLLRQYARHLAGTDESEATRHYAIRALLEYYLGVTARATAHFELADARVGLDQVRGPVEAPRLDTATAAEQWLDADWQNVVAAIHLADELGWHRFTCQLTRAVWSYLWRRGHNAESIDVHERAVAAAHHLGDLALEGAARNYLASACLRLNRIDDTVRQLHQSLALIRGSGDPTAEANTLGNLGTTLYHTGRFIEALGFVQESISVFAQGNQTSKLSATQTQALILVRLGRHTDALPIARRSRIDARRRGHQYAEALALAILGTVHLDLGRHRLAATLLTRAGELKHELGQRAGEAEALSLVGSAYRQLGHLDLAYDLQDRALQLVREVGEKFTEVTILNDLAITMRHTGNLAGAVDLHHHALGDASRIQARYQIARAHDGLGATLRDRDPAAAQQHWQQALTLYRDMQVPECSSVRRSLAELAG